MKHVLRLAKNLTLDLSAVTKMIAILAMRGMGKSYTASVLTEQMLKAGAHVVVVDPLGVFWGLRSSEDGRHEGLPIPIFGGDHADVPLDPASGATVADLVVNERLSVVLDLSRMQQADAARFMLAFAERLYHKNRKPLHLILDEADEWAPQHPMHGKERLLGAIENLVRRGRARGIGVTLVTQRSAVLNKNVLSQADLLIAMRTVAPQDRAAIDAWVKANGDEDGRRKVMDSMASLAIGEAWFWSPGWLGSLTRVKVNRRETFDSSATPKMGVRVREPRKLSVVDLDRIKVQMASTIKQAQEDDPRVLRSRLAELEIQHERLMRAKVESTSRPEIVERTKVVEKKIPWLGKRDIAALREAAMRLRLFTKHVHQIKEWLKSIGDFETITKLEGVANRLEAPINQVAMQNGVSVSGHVLPGPDRATSVPKPLVRHEPGMIKMPMIKTSPDPLTQSGTTPALLAGERRMVGALKAYHPKMLTKIQMCTLAGLSPNSGTTGNYVSNLVRRGVIRKHGDRFELIDMNALAISVDTSQRGLKALWDSQLLAGERRLLEIVMAHGEINRNGLLELAELANSGTSGNYLSRLRRCGLIEIEGGVVSQSKDLKELLG